MGHAHFRYWADRTERSPTMHMATGRCALHWSSVSWAVPVPCLALLLLFPETSANGCRFERLTD